MPRLPGSTLFAVIPTSVKECIDVINRKYSIPDPGLLERVKQALGDNLPSRQSAKNFDPHKGKDSCVITMNLDQTGIDFEIIVPCILSELVRQQSGCEAAIVISEPTVKKK